MIFWVVSGLLTALSLLILIRPLTKGPAAQEDDRLDRAQELYHDQMAEIDHDHQQGRLNDESHKRAGLELKRRFLRTQKKPSSPASGELSPQGVKLLVASIVIAFPLAALALYFTYGSPGIPSLPHRERLAMEAQRQRKESQEIDRIRSQIASELAQNPKNLRGWLALARLESRQGRLFAAEEAFKGALDNGGDDKAAIWSSYGEILIAAEDGYVSTLAAKALKESLARNAKDTRALFYSGLALYQNNSPKEALALWLKLRKGLKTDDPWLPFIEDQIRKTVPALDLSVEKLLAENPAIAPPQESGPSADDIVAAQKQSAEEQQEMIAGMVQTLAQRLRENPENTEGWLRLIRSYLVLQQPEKAREALKQGLIASQQTGNPQMKRELLQAFQEWGLEFID